MTIFVNRPHLTHKIWGGEKLSVSKELELEPKLGPLGETWEVSLINGCESLVGEKKLTDLVKPEECPYLIKFIDTSDNLSVQVHPGDDYAKKNENSTGKTECWVVLAAKKGEGIYLGLKKNVSKEQFFEAVAKGDDLSKFMRFFPVAKGDFFYVPAGTLHAIGKDVTIAEIQQPSGVTYRVWDWNRTDDQGNSRELHVKQAQDVSLFDEKSNEPKSFLIKANVFQFPNGTRLINHPNFRVRTYKMSRNNKMKIDLRENKLTTLIMCKGSLEINGSENISVSEFNTLSFQKESSIEVTSEKKVEFLLVD
jgi:mannose-6-phosphate isomerase